MSAQINHVAIVSDNYAQLAKFYEAMFGMKSAGLQRSASAVTVGDGYVGLNINPRRAGRSAGLDHFGIQVDDLVETQKRIEAAGGKFFFDLGDERAGNFERKFKDPDGVIFDISKHGWQGTDGYSKK